MEKFQLPLKVRGILRLDCYPLRPGFCSGWRGDQGGNSLIDYILRNEMFELPTWCGVLVSKSQQLSSPFNPCYSFTFSWNTVKRIHILNRGLGCGIAVIGGSITRIDPNLRVDCSRIPNGSLILTSGQTTRRCYKTVFLQESPRRGSVRQGHSKQGTWETLSFGGDLAWRSTCNFLRRVARSLHPRWASSSRDPNVLYHPPVRNFRAAVSRARSGRTCFPLFGHV